MTLADRCYNSIISKATYPLIKREYQMKILIYAPVLGRGGCKRVATKLAKAWLDLGHEVHFLGHLLDEQLSVIEWTSGVKIWLLPGGQHPEHPYLTRFLVGKYDDYYIQLKSLCEDHHYDMVFLPMPWHTMRQSQEEWDPKTKTVAFLPDFAHDYIPGIAGDWDIVLARREAFRFARYCHAIVFSSEFQRQIGITKYGMKNTHIIRKFGFVPPDFISDPEIDEEFRLFYNNLDEPYILAMHPYGHKDPHTIVKGYQIAKSIFPDLPKLVLAGIHSELLQPEYKTRDLHARSIQGLIKSYYQEPESTRPWERDFRFLGFVPEKFMRSLYDNSIMVLSASLSEGGVSGTICEAATAMRPVIYSDIPAHVEVLKNDVHGYCFQVGSSGDLALAICRAWNDYDSFNATAANLNRLVGDSPVLWKDIGKKYAQFIDQ